jgi:hypothetical protein
MAVSGQSLADGTLATSKTTIYTVPADTVVWPRFLSIFNTSVTAQTVLVYLKRSGSSSRTLRRYSLDQYENALVFDKDDNLCLSAGDEIEAETTTVGVVEYVLSGDVGYA